MSFKVVTGTAQRGAHGHSACGDAAVVVQSADANLFALIDALGHGPEAEESAARAVEIIRRDAAKPLKVLFQTVDLALRGKRGVVMSVVRLEVTGVVFAGVGNVDIHGPADVGRPTPMRGSLGSGRPFVFREFALPAAAGHRWVLVSDGIVARGVSAALHAVRQLDPMAAAQALLLNASRDDDDASVVVLDFEGASP